MPVQHGSKPGPCRGKKFLVTGGARGLGKAMVEELYAQGATVYAVGRSVESLSALEDELPGVKTISADLTDWDGTRKALENLEPLDGLINNAGASDIPGAFFEITPDKLDYMFNLDFKAAVNVSQVIARKMIEHGKGGAIVNIPASDTKRIVPALLGYSCIKSSLATLTKGMALELAPHRITVNSVAPSPVDGGAVAVWLNDAKDEASKEIVKIVKAIQERTPTGKPLMPLDEVVTAAIFFLSGVATQITGECLCIDGGFNISF